MRIPAAGAAGAVALLLALAGCGGGSDQQAKDAIAKELKTSTSSDFSLDSKQADCIASGMVDKIGVDNLKKYGILTDSLKAQKSPDSAKMSEKDANATADVFVGCVDVTKVIKDAMQLGDLDPAVSDCIDKALTESVVHDFLAAVFQGESQSADSMAALTGPLTTCMGG